MRLLVAGTERIRINIGGTVGIGFAPSTWADFVGLQVGANTSIWANTADAGTSYFSNNMYYNGSNRIFRADGYAAEYQITGANNHVWFTTNSGTAGGVVSLTERMRIGGSDGAIACTANTTQGPYFRAGNTISVANNGTVTITSSRAAAALICIYETANGLGGMFYANYSTAVTKIAGDGSATDAGANFAVYKSVNDHTTTFKNRSGGTATYTIAVYSSFSVN
jgi:hypothetical protein